MFKIMKFMLIYIVENKFKFNVKVFKVYVGYGYLCIGYKIQLEVFYFRG